jgi:hypothetical protein
VNRLVITRISQGARSTRDGVPLLRALVADQRTQLPVVGKFRAQLEVSRDDADLVGHHAAGTRHEKRGE